MVLQNLRKAHPPTVDYECSHTAKILVHRAKDLPALPLALTQYLARPIRMK